VNSLAIGSGIRHRVELTAESLFEAAALRSSLLRKTAGAKRWAPGAQVEVRFEQRIPTL
jgi:hypothetical protein